MIADKAQYEPTFASEEHALRFHPGADDPRRRKRNRKPTLRQTLAQARFVASDHLF
jgi:hypothetical protein